MAKANHIGALGVRHFNARESFSRGQQRFLFATGMAVVVGLVAGASVTDYLVIFFGIVSLAYFAQITFNTFLVIRASTSNAQAQLEVDLNAIPLDALPVYSVLVPLFKETSVLDDLIAHLSRLEYPREHLQILLLLEEDDHDMVKAVQSRTLPAHMQVILVPPSLPRTKPKALNHGLQFVKGEYCAVYDAEDNPDPFQLLKAIAAFQQADDRVACVQGMLAYHNPRQNMLTRFFAAEYASWFRLYIPGLSTTNLLFLLGGTSNHFRTAILRELGGWDAYNVTEDADLGVRLARAGYTVKAIASITWEEANSHPWNWVRQRSRWIKGYMQTYLTHMRDPGRLWAELGTRRFLAFQIMVGVAPLSNLLNPVLWAMTIIYWVTRSPFIESLFPGPLFYLGAVLLFAGNLISVYVQLNGAMIQQEYASVKWMLFCHIYWLLMSIAAWRAFYQLLVKPHYWEKTHHGLHSTSAIKSVAVAQPSD